MTDGAAETIKELKAAILAIEWEISDAAMDNLARAITPLQAEWAGRKPRLVCLQIIATLGQYIKKARERAHQDAIKLLHSVFATLEQVVAGDLSEAEKVALVRTEVEKYNALKAELAKPRAPQPAPPSRPVAPQPSPVAAAEPPGGGGSTMRDLMDQKEDSAVDGAFNTLFQGMVEPERPAAPPAMPPMPSAGQGPDAKEIRLDRVDDEIFPEADSLLDEFFADETSVAAERQAAVSVAPAPVVAEEEAVEVDIGQIAPERKEEVAGPEAPVMAAAEEEEVRADKLGRIILRITHRVSDEALSDLAAEAADLRRRFPEHLSVHLFLELIAALGRHLQRLPTVKREESCRLLQKTYDRLNHALFTMKPGTTLLGAHLEAIADYVAWNEGVCAAPVQAEPPATVAPVEAEAAVLSADMEAAVTAIVRREVEKLRAEFLQQRGE